MHQANATPTVMASVTTANCSANARIWSAFSTDPGWAASDMSMLRRIAAPT
jgi:hypothetical protein